MQYINIHTHHYRHAGSPNHLELLNQYPDQIDIEVPYYSVGIHPWYIHVNDLETEMDIIEKSMIHPGCLAIGECGLDKRIETPITVQLPVFEQQLLLAEQSSKPVIIHCVGAFQELIETVKSNRITVPLIVHGFSKSKQLASQLLDNGFYLSFGKYLLSNPELRDAFTIVPEDRYFLETDNSSDNIEQVYIVASNHRRQPIEKIEEHVSTNFNTVFNNHS